MSKFLKIAILLFFVTLKATAQQPYLMFIDKDGKEVSNKGQANSYVVVQKLDDSAWMVKEFDLRDTILSSALYKDEKLTIPTGKFIAYEKRLPIQGFSNRGIDTLNHIKTSGYFLNGKKTGVWYDFLYGKKRQFKTYKDDIEDGLNAQIRKIFMTTGDVRTSDSSKAISYLLYQKMQNDSGWDAYKYNMHDSIMVKGTYKDEDLTIPHGKFTYYRLLKPVSPTQIKYNYVEHRIDTVKEYPKNFITSVGYFINGKKEGTWIDNDFVFNIHTVLNYHDSKLNGAFQNYKMESGVKILDGQFENDKRTGQWVEFGTYGDTVMVFRFKNGVAKSTKRYEEKHEVIGTKPLYNIIHYLNSELAQTRFVKTGTFYAIYGFTVTKMAS